MTAICIAPPTELAVSVEEAKDSLSIDGSDMDGKVGRWIRGVTAALEQKTGQCLMEQGWRVTLPEFAGSIRLPHPAISITSVAYVDAAGADQVLDPAAYRLQVSRYRSDLLPARGGRWPATFVDLGIDSDLEPVAVTVDVLCGYGSTAESTPPDAQLYILAKLVEQYDPASRLEKDTNQSEYTERLLDALTVHG